jgi:hypothetical protein
MSAREIAQKEKNAGTGRSTDKKEKDSSARTLSDDKTTAVRATVPSAAKAKTSQTAGSAVRNMEGIVLLIVGAVMLLCTVISCVISGIGRKK